MQPGMQAGKCAEREVKVAQGLGKAGEGLLALQVILTPHPAAIGTEIQFGGFTGPEFHGWE